MYHLYLLQILNECTAEEKVMSYHFLMLRQLFRNNLIFFFGTGGIKKALEEIGYIENLELTSNRINSLSHKDARMQPAEVNQNDIDFLSEVFNNIIKSINLLYINMAQKDQYKIIGDTLWDIANDLRGAMNPDDFRDYMLSFLFLRYLSFNYEEAAKRIR